MKNKTIFIGIASIAIIGIAVFCTRKTISYKKNVRLDKIAEAGYETAADILYPDKNTSPRGSRARA